MYLFLLQVDTAGKLSPDNATVAECVSASCWYTQPPEYKIVYSTFDGRCGLSPNSTTLSISDCSSQIFSGEKIIPVGSVEFVEKMMGLFYGKKHLKPIGIPEEILANQELMQELLHRKVVKCRSDSISRNAEVLSGESLFVKDVSRVKPEFGSDIVDRKDLALLNVGPMVELSEVFESASEWRAFVFAGRIRDIRCYSGDPFLIPAKGSIQNILTQCKSAPRACTIDVMVQPAKGNQRRTALVEVHRFIACGLYGFDNFSVIPQMLISAFEEELKSK